MLLLDFCATRLAVHRAITMDQPFDNTTKQTVNELQGCGGCFAIMSFSKIALRHSAQGLVELLAHICCDFAKGSENPLADQEGGSAGWRRMG
jgi:hypothetical protein